MEINKINDTKIAIEDDDGTIYTMINMGDYVGHRSRNWYETPSPYWSLMFVDNESKDLHMEALIDDTGNYIDLKIACGIIKRAIAFKYGSVISDLVMYETDELIPADAYYKVEIDNRIPLNKYLGNTHVYKDEDIVFDGVVPNDELIKDFFLKNKEYKEIIEKEELAKKR